MNSAINILRPKIHGLAAFEKITRFRGAECFQELQIDFVTGLRSAHLPMADAKLRIRRFVK
jgi:hypothetical protein